MNDLPHLLSIVVKASDFHLPNSEGMGVTLSLMVKEDRVVLVFYRGTWCSANGTSSIPMNVVESPTPIPTPSMPIWRSSSTLGTARKVG